MGNTRGRVLSGRSGVGSGAAHSALNNRRTGKAVVSDLFAEMALDLHKFRTSPARTLERIVDWARLAADCSGAGIMVRTSGGRFDTPVSTSPGVKQAHDLQVKLGEGPCLDALRGQGDSTYVTGNAGADPRYPKWGPAVANLGFSSVMSVQLATEERRYGSLNLYSDQPHSFTRDDLAITEIFARHASVAISNAEEGHGLKIALDARKLIGQAQGILMERYDINGDVAFDFMCRHSQENNVKLRAIAEWIVANRASPSLLKDLP